MAVIDEKPETVADSTSERRLAVDLHLSRESWAYIVLIAIAAALRFWDLGTRMLHHDESLHAVYSWYLYNGRGYKHDPMMHGPFKFHIDALMYFVLGVSDAVSRVAPAIFGTALVGLPYLLRNRLGKSAALVAAFLLTFSPSFLYYSRFIRDDIFIVTWTILLVILMFRYFENRRPLYLYLLAAVLSLSFTTMENTYITLAIFGSYLMLTTGLDVLKLLRSRAPLRADTDVMVLFGTFLLPLVTGFAAKGESLLKLAPLSAGEIAYFAAIFVVLLAISIYFGLRWNSRIWPQCALIFWGIYITLYTTVFGNPEGFATGAVGGLKYWLEQQGVARGDQPWYYYLVLLPIYEFVPIIFGLGALVFFARKRDRFIGFLIYWLFGSLALYGWAAEKMPWLVVHMALPMILLAAVGIGRLIDAPGLRRALRRDVAYLAILAILAVFVLYSVLSRLQGMAGLTPILRQQQSLRSIVLALLLLALLGGAVYVGRRLGLRPSLQVVALAAFVVLTPFSMHAAWQVTYLNGDVPVEMMVYTQTSPDVGRVMKEIERIGFRTGTGQDLKVAYDSDVSWPFEWYLRDYKSRSFYGEGMPPVDAPVVLVGFDNDHDSKVRPALTANYVGQRYKLRWWFPEDYRGMTFQRIWQGITEPALRAKLRSFFLYREPFSPLGSTDFMLYVRKDLAEGPWAVKTGSGVVSATAPQPVADPYVASARQLTGVETWGSKGAAAGQFQEPKGLAVGPDGSVYVLDTGNNRVQKLDAQGKFVLAWGEKGQGDGDFAEPWGIAVDEEGVVYVADTWNHRIQRFDANGSFIGKWGQFANVADAVAAPGGFFGPRGIAVGADGFVYVTDTGNHRVQKFDRNGSFVASAGGRGAAPGQFNEPVGVASERDGSLLVADTWNRRVQVLDADLKPVRQWSVGGWTSNSVLDKPYVATDLQGNVFASDPENNRVLQFAADGSIVAAWGRSGSDLPSLRLPTGVALDSAGRVLVADSLNNRVLRFAPLR
ncbi:MAG: TIGR03663 family protein [Chloroflexi bacterium]|nr:TIGR03663 family protein [Chloroflexota bacterium]